MQYMHEGSRAFTLMCNRGGMLRAQNVEAAGQGLSRLPRLRGIYVHACPRPRASQGRGRHGGPRPEAETSMFCARIARPRLHTRINERTGPSCTPHRWDLRRNKCMHERPHMHQHACCIILIFTRT
eukprot:353614-Chlamydomonas_euryale.AAC.2